MNDTFPIALVILDGLGLPASHEEYGYLKAHIPFLFTLMEKHPHCVLKASGEAVGLLPGVAGNSVVGHMAIGAGRIITQPVTTIHTMIQDGTFYRLPLLQHRFEQLLTSGGTLHLMGLLSDGSNHSNDEIVPALLRYAQKVGIKRVIVHAFLDGKDTPPRSAAQYLTKLEDAFAEIGIGELGSLHGRAYAMGHKAYSDMLDQTFRVLTQPTDTHNTDRDWRILLKHYYDHNMNDDSFLPTALIPESYIRDGDGLIYWNIRADRARPLTEYFLEASHPRLLWFITGIPYHPQLRTDVLIVPPIIKNTLFEVLHGAGVHLGILGETDKYGHVTYFFNGGTELENLQDLLIIVPSPEDTLLEQNPQMSAHTLTTLLRASHTVTPRDWYLINYANADMLGHTGNITATSKALITLNRELQELYTYIVHEQHGTLYITADHGNAEAIITREDGQPHTHHTADAVPFIYISQNNTDLSRAQLHTLADIAPFMLQQMGIQIPPEMTGSQ